MDANSNKNLAAVALGSLGGKAKSDKKSEAARENGKKGGRPKKIKEAVHKLNTNLD